MELLQRLKNGLWRVNLDKTYIIPFTGLRRAGGAFSFQYGRFRKQV
jgi:hypothetical protein